MIQVQSVKTIEQRNIHNGLSFRWTESPAAALTASTGEILLLVTTPAASASFAGASLVVSGSVQAVSRVQIFTGSTRTAGAARTPINRNRLSAATSQLAIASAPTGGADGSLLAEYYVGLNDFADKEFILAPNTKYLVRVLNHTSAAANFATLALDWFEITRIYEIQ